jgi:hypothetical protein
MLYEADIYKNLSLNYLNSAHIPNIIDAFTSRSSNWLLPLGYFHRKLFATHIILDTRKWISSVHLRTLLRTRGTINVNQPQMFKLTLQNTEWTVYSASLRVRSYPLPTPRRNIILSPSPPHTISCTLRCVVINTESAFVLMNTVTSWGRNALNQTRKRDSSP